MKRRSFLKLGLLAAAASAVGIRPSKASAPDPIQQANPPFDYDAVMYWYRATLHVDIDVPEDRVFFMVQTRLHEDDLSSRMTVEKFNYLELSS